MYCQNSIGIDIQGNTVTLAWIKAGLWRVELKALEIYRSESGENPLSDIDSFLDEFVGKYKIASVDVYVGIPEAVCLTKTIKLPFSVRDDVASVLQYEIEKYIPVPVSTVEFGYKLLAENRSEGWISVLLQMVQKQDLAPFISLKDYFSQGITAVVFTKVALDCFITHLQSGRKPKVLGCESLPENDIRNGELRAAALAFQAFKPDEPGINFLPERFRKRPSRRPLMLFAALASGCVIMLFLMGASFYIHTQMQNRQLDTRLSYLKKQVKKVDKIESGIQVLAQKKAEIEKAIHSRPMTLDILRELTRIIPDQTFLQEFEFKGNVIRMRGVSNNASRLIEPLERSEFFSKVGFESKITIKEKGQELFIIKMVYNGTI